MKDANYFFTINDSMNQKFDKLPPLFDRIYINSKDFKTCFRKSTERIQRLARENYKL